MFKWQLYTAQAMRSKWSNFMGSDLMEQDDDEQDVLKETFLETNPILLGLTVLISITHSIFEFLAFKNDIQFWRERRSLEGLSVRSVFFNVFQSAIVLLYVWDNDTNIMIRISVGIGLLIELWKIKKVIDIEVVHDEKLFGLFPKIRFSDKGSYVNSSTRQYDNVSCIVNRIANVYCVTYQKPCFNSACIQIPVMGHISTICRLWNLFVDLQRTQRMVLVYSQHGLRFLAYLWYVTNFTSFDNLIN